MEIVDITHIEELMTNRLMTTSSIHKKMLESDIEDTDFERNIFVNYYLDFSTGIEFLIRQILLKKYGEDKFIKDKIKIEKNPMFYDYSDIEKLIGNSFPTVKWSNYKFFSSCCYDIKQSDYSNHPDDYEISIEDFKNAYTQAKNTRNSIAHGFECKNVVYSKKMVLLFSLSYFILLEFYRHLK